MFNRKVMIDGTVYSYHEVAVLKHTAKRATAITARSYRDNPNYGTTSYRDRIFEIQPDDGMTFAAAENYISNLDAFKEYQDQEATLLEELAPSLTDEQAALVTSFYPQWSPIETYEVGARVRYSNGFYKCIQAHTAQESWYPAASPSLWTAIIDASILPIGEYPLWQQPESTNPYMTGDCVTYQDNIWQSIVDNNVWAPGVYGWEIYSAQPQPDDGTPQSWTQPDSTNPYMAGDRVEHNGTIWISEIDNNVWEPGIYGWIQETIEPEIEGETGDTGMTGEIIEPEIEGETGETGETTEPEQQGSSIQEWSQPSSVNPYMAGDKVTHQGLIWESNIDNNVWEPGVYGWTQI